MSPDFVHHFHGGCILQVNILQKRVCVLQEELNIYQARRYMIIFGQFVPFHTCGSQLLKFYGLIKTLKYSYSFKRSLFSVNKRLRPFPVLSQYY